MPSDKIKTGQKFEAVLQRFEVPLLQYAARITGDRERARDVVQETFIKFQRNGALSRDDESATWLFTVCRNGALNICRKEAAGFLTRIVATLPPRQQEVLQLKFQNGLSYQQIADITKTTANCVGVLIHTALKTLRQRYREASKDFLSFNPRTN